MHDIISQKYKQYENVEYDTTGKLKAVCHDEAKADRIKFTVITLGLVGTAYFIAAII